MFDIATEFYHHLRDFRGIRLFAVKILRSSCNVFCFVQRLTHFALMGKFCKSNLKNAQKKEAVYASFFVCHQYISGLGAGAGVGGSGMSHTMDSVVSNVPATLAAFCKAERVTFVGSSIPFAIMSP